jgi:hypothetical protein
VTTSRSPYGGQPYASASSDQPAYGRLDYGHAPHHAPQQQPYQQSPPQYQPSPRPRYQPTAPAPEAKKQRKWPFVAAGIILLVLIISIAGGGPR